jgi:phosphocarrier protein
LHLGLTARPGPRPEVAVSQRCTVQVTIINRLGLHARPAMTFVDLASTFKSDVTVKRGDQEVDGKSIMHMMMLAATKGTTLEVIATGNDAERACAALKKLVDSGFDEE